MLPKEPRYENRAYLSWAKEQCGVCCLCFRRSGRIIHAAELHHFGDKGMGQKCHAYEVARVCNTCHEAIQGKRRSYFSRTNEWEMLAAMQEDALNLLMAWVEHGGRK